MAGDSRSGWVAVPTDDFSVSPVQKSRRCRASACCCACLPGCALVTGLLLVVFGVLVVIYMQSQLDAYINQMLMLSEDSRTFAAWKKPPVKIKTKLFFFNLTNEEAFVRGDEKPRVEEVGPYVLGEEWDRRNITFHQNGTLSSQLSKTIFFLRDESAGPDTDLITTLNVPMMSAATKARYQPRTMQLTTSSLLEVLEERPIITRSVHELIVGYKDPLLKLAKDIQPPGQSLPFESFGYFVGKNGSVGKPMLINTGRSNWLRIGAIERYDGAQTLPFWNTRQCNMVNGSDGSIYPPGADENSTMYLFAPDICRSMPLVFEKHVLHQGVRTLRFTPPEDVFDSVDTKPENMCFCVGGRPCAPKGVFNISVCQFGSPTFVSFPHFYLADPSIPAKVDGLKPDKNKHQLFVDYVPRVGVSMKAKIRVQINFKIGPVPNILYTQTLPDMFYPVFWMEAGVDKLPPDAVHMVRQATETPEVARTTVTAVAFVLGAVLLLCGATVLLLRRRAARRAAATAEADAVKNGKQMELKSPPAPVPPATNGRPADAEPDTPAV